MFLFFIQELTQRWQYVYIITIFHVHTHQKTHPFNFSKDRPQEIIAQFNADKKAKGKMENICST